MTDVSINSRRQRKPTKVEMFGAELIHLSVSDPSESADRGYLAKKLYGRNTPYHRTLVGGLNKPVIRYLWDHGFHTLVEKDGRTNVAWKILVGGAIENQIAQQQLITMAEDQEYQAHELQKAQRIVFAIAAKPPKAE